MRVRHCFILFLSIFFSGHLFSQTVYERHTDEVYQFLSRLSQKGVIELDDLVVPVSKKQLAIYLDTIQVHSGGLSQKEKKELEFYRDEYNENGRHRTFSVNKDNFNLNMLPVLTAAYTGGPGKSFTQTSTGVNLWGTAGKNWGFQLSFRDINENGSGLDSFKNSISAGSGTGAVIFDQPGRKNALNFSEIRAHISYSFKNGAVSIGQDYLLWGYGENGRMVLSDKAPAYPYIRVDYKPLRWFRFNYVHAWLQSGLLDSNSSYTIPGGTVSGIRQVFINKYMAAHSAEFIISKKLTLSLGESVIYNDHLNIGYLLPVMFFKAYDHYASRGEISAGSNSQFYFQASSRNNLPKTHLYASLFIDEIRVKSFFNTKKARNQLGYNLGASVTDIIIPYLTAGAEYTRIRPFVYRNFLPAQDYSSGGYYLGDWMGNNADRFLIYLKYTPLPKLKLSARYQYVRKGGPGTIKQQYNDETQPDFLFDFQESQNEIYLAAYYQWIHRLVFNADLSVRKNSFFNIGITYGL
ncbi:MAG: hypothetical protein JWN76_942 [Chitinophagaceae bacterium]|nr:hypothetical protein [Chitinophagaceae bacterium]